MRRRARTFDRSQWNLGLGGDAARERSRRRFTLQPEALEGRALLTTITRSGGVGGTTENLPLPADLNLVTFSWDNYSIPDEFQIQQGGRRIAGDLGLQSGGRSGRTVVAKGASGSLTVKVTAPTRGTAWDFSVTASAVELHVDALLGDVTKVDVGRIFQAATGQALASVGLDPSSFQFVSMTNARGKVAEIDNWQDELKNGVFYFVPTVAGAPLDYQATHTTDAGLGDSELRIRGTITDEGGSHQVEFPVKFTVADGFSTTGDNQVDGAGTARLDVYRHQQRLAYLGYPGANGSPLAVDGSAGNNLTHARRMFSVATAAGYPPPGVLASNINAFKANINNAAAPSWIDMSSIAGVTWYSQRRFGIAQTGDLLANARAAVNVVIVSGGSALRIGNAPPSHSHDAGRGFDIDNIPGPFLFGVVGSPGVPGGFVRAPGPNGSIVVQDGNGYRLGHVSVPADRANGLRANTLNGSTTAALATQLHNLGLLAYSEPEATVRSMLEAFVNAGANRIFYNDPRFIGTAVNGVNVGFSRGHFNHMHFNIPSPTAAAAPAPLAAFRTMRAFAAATSAPPATMQAPPAADLGRLTTARTVTGSVDVANPERLYRFEINDPALVYEEDYYDTPRDVTIGLSGLSADADLQLAYDLNEDGVIDPDEVLYDSTTAGTGPESLTALQLPTGVYYARVLGKGAATPFSLTLAPVPLAVPADGAGETVATAADLGTPAGTVTRDDFVGEVDPQDLYKFRLASISDVAVQLGGLDQAAVTLALGRDDDGDGVLDPDEILAFSDEPGDAAESLQILRLAAGDYLVQVLRSSGNSDYQLQLTASASSIPADQAGDEPAAARDLGVLGAAPLDASDFVGGVDPTDLYKFTVGGIAGLTIDLTDLAADADLRVYRDANGDGLLGADELLAQSSAGGSVAERVVLAGLNPGVYFVRVGRYDGDTTYSLTLTPQAAAGADLAVTRAGAPASADLGSRLVYSVTVTNNGPDGATNVLLTEALPSGLVLIDAASTSGGVRVRSTDRGFEGRIAALEPGASVTFDVVASTFIAGRLPTTTTVTSDTADYDASNNVLVDLKQVNPIASPPADLELSQAVNDATPDVGEPIIITLSLVNKGPGTATDIQVRNLLPDGLAHISSDADLGFYTPADGVWTVGNILPGATVRLRIQARVTTARPLTNTAEVLAVAEADPDSTPNNGRPGEDDFTSLTINPAGSTADLALAASVGDPTPDLGGQVVVTITLTNDGPGSATGVRVRAALPAGLTYVASTADLGSYDAANGVWTVGDVAAGSSASLRITVVAAAAGPQSAFAEIVGRDQADPDRSDDQATASFVVQAGGGDEVGPRVAGIDRFGVNGARTAFVLTFDEPLDAARANDIGSYRLVDPGRDGRFGTRDDRAIRIRSVAYNPSDFTVTLTPATRIPMARRVQLTVFGTGATAVTDVPGNRLDGDADGRPGGDHGATLRGFARGRGQGFDLRPLDVDGDGKVTPLDLRLIRGRLRPPLAALAARRFPTRPG